MIGLPVFAGGAGPLYLLGPTGGYLIGFLLSVWCVGGLKHKSSSLLYIFGLMILGHVIILACGAVWLAFGVPSLGFEQAVFVGILPFIIGSVLKSALAAAIVAYPKIK